MDSPATTPADTLPQLRRLAGSARMHLARGFRSRMFSGFVIVAGLTLLAKAVSFFKDAVVAHRFGTANELDAFMLSFSLLSFLAAVVGGGMPEAFLPAFARLSNERSLRRAHRLGIQMMLCNLIVLGGLGAVAYLAGPWIVAFIGRGFDMEKQRLALRALRGLVPFFIAYGLSFHFATWLRAQKRFLVATSAPLILPAFLMLCLCWAGESASLGTLVFGTTAGACLQVGWLAFIVGRELPRHPRWLGRSLTGWEPHSREVLTNTLPFLMGGVVMGSSTMVDQAMAAWLQPGSVVVLGYADKVCGIVLALTAVPASEAMFPYFAETVAKRDWVGVRRQFFQSVGVILLLATPMTLALLVGAPWIVRVLFERGAFHAEDTQRVAEVLRFAALQIPFYVIGVLASRIVVSMQAARFLLVVSLALLAANIALNAWFMQYWGVAGIALSTAAVHFLCAATLFMFVLREVARLSAENSRTPAAP